MRLDRIASRLDTTRLLLAVGPRTQKTIGTRENCRELNRVQFSSLALSSAVDRNVLSRQSSRRASAKRHQLRYRTPTVAADAAASTATASAAAADDDA